MHTPVAGLDAENAEDRVFKKLKQHASEELQKSLVGKKKAAKDKPPQPSERKPPPKAAGPAPPDPAELQKHEEEKARVHAEHKQHQMKAAERLNGLTPDSLKTLLPGGDSAELSIEFHPVQKHFRVKYP